jgi:DNA-binding MarR family transcriptional regulator
METAGLITRTRAVSDERQVIIKLTKNGDGLRQKAMEVQGEVFCATECELDELIVMKEKLVELRSKLARNG